MIISDGKLNFPLYHGTSDYFISKIKEHGLGGYRDQDIFSLDVLRSLADALEVSAAEWWSLQSTYVNPMLQQRVTNGEFNFRYGSVYLTPSKSTACNYAGNCLGSEFLTVIYEMYRKLFSVNPSEAELIIPGNHPLRSVFDAVHRPVVIALRDVKLDMLRTEQGEPVEQQLNEMLFKQNFGETFDVDRGWQQFNFELIGSIDWSLINVVFLDVSEIGGD